MAVPIAIPCKVLVCSYAAPNAKSKAEKGVAVKYLLKYTHTPAVQTFTAKFAFNEITNSQVIANNPVSCPTRLTYFF